VEQSIVKRAWPYALALAVVVTGCYLVLAPLLRSLSPAPAASATRLNQTSNTTTVGRSKTFNFVGKAHGQNSYASALTTKKKAKKVAKKPVKTTTPQVSAPPAPSSNTTGFANNPPSSSSSSSTPKSTPTTPSTTTKSANRKNSAVGGQIDQSQSDNGFAGPTGNGPVTGGQTLAPGN
jgi:hypothetical protein